MNGNLKRCELETLTFWLRLVGLGTKMVGRPGVNPVKGMEVPEKCGSKFGFFNPDR